MILVLLLSSRPERTSQRNLFSLNIFCLDTFGFTDSGQTDKWFTETRRLIDTLLGCHLRGFHLGLLGLLAVQFSLLFQPLSIPPV